MNRANMMAKAIISKAKSRAMSKGGEVMKDCYFAGGEVEDLDDSDTSFLDKSYPADLEEVGQQEESKKAEPKDKSDLMKKFLLARALKKR